KTAGWPLFVHQERPLFRRHPPSEPRGEGPPSPPAPVFRCWPELVSFFSSFWKRHISCCKHCANPRPDRESLRAVTEAPDSNSLEHNHLTGPDSHRTARPPPPSPVPFFCNLSEFTLPLFKIAIDCPRFVQNRGGSRLTYQTAQAADFVSRRA